MKLHSLISAVVLGMAVLVQAQDKPGAPDAASKQKQKSDASNGPFLVVGADLNSERRMEIVILKAGPLTEVVAQAERYFIDDPKKPNEFLPNLIYDKDARDAVMPGELTLRRVTPVQALALAAAAAGCTLETIFAPQEGGSSASSSPPVIGYRIVQAYNPYHAGENADITGIGITLVNKSGKVVIGEVLPGSPADRSRHIKPGDRLLSVGERGSDHVPVEGLPLQKVAELMRGTPGTPVHLKLESDRNGEPVTIDAGLVREKLNPPASEAMGGGTKVKVISPISGAMLTAEGLIYEPYASVPASAKPLGSRPMLPEESNPMAVRVYALGSILSGSEREELYKKQCFEMLIGEALEQAGVADKVAPHLSFHMKSKALIVKATARKHEIIEQVIKALKENETQPAAPAKP